jgi:hypothetical protein
MTKKIFWFIMLVFALASLGAGCADVNSRYKRLGGSYKLPEDVENPAVIMGDILFADDSTETRIVLTFLIDEAEAPPDAPTRPLWVRILGDYKNPLTLAEETARVEFRVAPGKRALDIQIIRKFANSFIDIDRRHLVEVDLQAGGTYQLTGEKIVGSAFKFWVEDTSSRVRITEIYYDPDDLRDILIDADNQRYLSGAHGLLKSNAGDAFASKTVLLPDHDCFYLVHHETIDPELIVLSLPLAVFGWVYTGEYGFKVYKEICIDVVNGHEYELISYPEGACGTDPDIDEYDCTPIPSHRYELWDNTSQKRLLEFHKSDLELYLDDVE